MEMWAEAVNVIGTIVELAGWIALVVGVITLIFAIKSQNSDAKDNASLAVGVGLGVVIIARTLIPMLADVVSF